MLLLREVDPEGVVARRKRRLKRRVYRSKVSYNAHYIIMYLLVVYDRDYLCMCRVPTTSGMSTVMTNLRHMG